jgi:uncharacterized protein (TIGR02117 family)
MKISSYIRKGSKIILLPFLLILFYFMIALLFCWFPKNHIEPSPQHHQTKTVYILYDEMHSDIVLKIDKKWQTYLPEITKNRQGYLAFGWGDKETYLNTPTWSDLKLSTTLKALFINTPSLIHMSYYPNIHHSANLKSIHITKKQYQKIEDSLLKSFGKSPTYYHQGYGLNDAFYTSPLDYNLIQTCNTWSGDILRDANISMSYWTPFSACVTKNLQN